MQKLRGGNSYMGWMGRHVTEEVTFEMTLEEERHARQKSEYRPA